MGLFSRLFQTAAAQDTRSLLEQTRLIEGLFAKNNFQEALAVIGNGLQSRSDDPNLWFLKGMGLWHLGKYSDALLCFDNAIARKSAHAGAWCFKGDTFLKLGRSSEAKDAFTRFLEVAPASDGKQIAEVTAILQSLEKGLGESNNDEERKEKAKELARQAGSLEEKRNYKDALMLYDEALRIAPASDKALLSALWTFRETPCKKLWKWDEVLRCWNSVIEIGPDGLKNWHEGLAAEAWCQKAFALEMLKKNDEALTCYKEALGMNPKQEMAEHLKGKIALLGRPSN